MPPGASPPRRGPPAPVRGHPLASLEAERTAEREREERLERFRHAPVPKSRFELQREAEERKRKREEEENVQAYQQFLRDMEMDEGPSAWRDASRFVGAEGLAYVPSRAEPQSPSKPDAGAPLGDVRPVKKSPRKNVSHGAMRNFLSELKRDQARREEKLRSRVGEGGSISSYIANKGKNQPTGPEPLSTNIRVSALPPDATEEEVGRFFARWGDVGIVQLEHPADRAAQVAYLRREDAELALREVGDTPWDTATLRADWARTVTLPTSARFEMPPDVLAARMAVISGASSERARQTSPMPIRHRHGRLPGSRPPERELLARIARLPERKAAVEQLAHRARTDGLETVVEQCAEQYPFLREPKSDAFQYLQHCLDPGHVPALAPEPFQDEGYASMYSTDSEELSETEKLQKVGKSTRLGDMARRRLEGMLRSLTPRRERIARCMALALDNAHAADTIAELISRSLLIPSTPVPRKIARLYVVSDILYNSAAATRNAWRYRAAFEPWLLPVFSHLGTVAHSFSGRMKTEAVVRQVLAVLDCWDIWLVLPPSLVTQLRSAVTPPDAAP